MAPSIGQFYFDGTYSFMVGSNLDGTLEVNSWEEKLVHYHDRRGRECINRSEESKYFPDIYRYHYLDLSDFSTRTCISLYYPSSSWDVLEVLYACTISCDCIGEV